MRKTIKIPACGGERFGPKTAKEVERLRGELRKREQMISLDQQGIAKAKATIERAEPSAANGRYWSVEAIRDLGQEITGRKVSLRVFQLEAKKVRAQIYSLEHPSKAALAKRRKDIVALAKTARNRCAFVKRIGAAAAQLGQLLDSYDRFSAKMRALAQSTEFEGPLDDGRFRALAAVLPDDDLAQSASEWLSIFLGRRPPKQAEAPAPPAPPLDMATQGQLVALQRIAGLSRADAAKKLGIGQGVPSPSLEQLYRGAKAQRGAGAVA